MYAAHSVITWVVQEMMAPLSRSKEQAGLTSPQSPSQVLAMPLGNLMLVCLVKVIPKLVLP